MSRNKFSPRNTNGLPERLIFELSDKKRDASVIKRVEFVFLEGGGTLDISELLIGYYKIYKEVKTRKTMTHIVHRMKNKGMIKPTLNKVGEYTLVRDGDMV